MCAGELRHDKVVDYYVTAVNSSFCVLCFIYPNNSSRIYTASCCIIVNSMEDERKIRFEDLLCFPCALGAKLRQ